MAEILPKMTLEQYHNDYKHIPSPSALSAALKSDAHLSYYLTKKRAPSDEYNLGTFIHEYIENGGKIPSEIYERQDELYQRASGEHQAGDPKLDDEGDPKFTYICKTDPTRSLTPAKSKLAFQITEQFVYNNTFGELFERAGEVIIEQSMVGKVNGVDTKCRPDILFIHEDKVLVLEIKTTRQSLISQDGFARDFFDYDYDMQCYIETEIVKQNYPDKKVDCMVLAVSTDMPCGIATYYMCGDLVKTGSRKANTAVLNWSKYHKVFSDKPSNPFYIKPTEEIKMSFRATDYFVQEGLE